MKAVFFRAAVLAAILLLMPGRMPAQSVPEVGPTVCVANCGSTSRPTTTNNATSSTVSNSAAEQERRRKQEQERREQEEARRRKERQRQRQTEEAQRAAEHARYQQEEARRDQERFAARKLQVEGDLKDAPNDGDTVKDLKPAPLGEKRKARGTGIKKLPSTNAAAKPVRNQATKEAAAALGHGQSATNLDSAGASAEAGKVFDTAGNRAPQHEVEVGTLGAERRIPARLAQDPVAKKKYDTLQAEKQNLLEDRRALEIKLTAIRQQQASGTGDQKALQMQGAELKQYISTLDGKLAMNKTKTEAFLVSFEEAPAPAAKKRTEPPPPATDKPKP